MRRSPAPGDTWLTMLVVSHLAVAIVHGLAHVGANVRLSLAGAFFVALVIVAGPVVGLIVHRRLAGGLGAWLIATTLAGALAFGLINHYGLESADHVRHVTGPWRTTFVATATLLAVTEFAGAAAAVVSALRAQQDRSQR